MTPVKTWCLLHLSVLFIAPTVSEVVRSMAECAEFLLNNEPPQVPGILVDSQIQDNNRYKVICQTYDNVRRFVTLYDTTNKIPVLSAFKFKGRGEGDRSNTWKMEPQLEDTTKGNNMVNDKTKKKTSKTKKDSSITAYNKQASDKDYNGKGFDRGHLLPSSYAKHQDEKTSTFTLTNVVPQVPSFNQGSWNKMEERIKSIMAEYCINNNGVTEAYVMVGAKPSDGNTINNRVNVPSLLWSAFCCYSKNLNRWIASAHWGDNVEDKDKQTLPTKTLKQLYDKLSDGPKRFEAFPESKCPLDKTVAELDSTSPNESQNPPSVISRFINQFTNLYQSVVAYCHSWINYFWPGNNE